MSHGETRGHLIRQDALLKRMRVMQGGRACVPLVITAGEQDDGQVPYSASVATHGACQEECGLHG